MTMTSSRPYLLRALHEWIVDNGLTPHVLVDASQDDVQVPKASIQDGKVVLNIAPSAVRDLELENDWVSCVARFSGVSHGIVVPVSAVRAIYARENGQGMMFPEVEDDPPSGGPDGQGESGDSEGGKDRGHLKVIK